MLYIIQNMSVIQGPVLLLLYDILYTQSAFQLHVPLDLCEDYDVEVYVLLLLCSFLFLK